MWTNFENESKSIIGVTEIPICGYLVSHNTKKPDPGRFKALLDLPAPSNLPAQKRVVGMLAYYSKWIQNFSMKIRPLIKNTTFPLSDEVKTAFQELKKEVECAAFSSPDPNIPFVVETDASDFAIGATLNQNGRPIAFFSRNESLEIDIQRMLTFTI